jgi:hypothetical protein
MASQQIKGETIETVIWQQSVHHHHVHDVPQVPADPAMSRQCPQCQRLTWRYTQVCIHCQLDLQAWDKRAAGGWLQRLSKLFSGGG